MLRDKYGQTINAETAEYLVNAHNIWHFSRWDHERQKDYWTQYAADAANEPDFYWEDVQQNALTNILDDHQLLDTSDEEINEFFEQVLRLAGRK